MGRDKDKKDAPAPKAAEVKPVAVVEKEDVATPLMNTGFKFWLVGIALMAVLAGWHFRSDIKGWFTSGTTDITGGPPVGGLQVGGRPGEGVGSFTTPAVIRVNVDPNQWSDWIRLPVNCKFQVDRPGWIEYKFIDGNRRRCQDDTTRWLGTIPQNTFQLRGEAGEVVITYTR